MANKAGIKVVGFLEQMILEILYAEPRIYSSRLAWVFRKAGRSYSISAIDYALARMRQRQWVAKKLSATRHIRGGRRRWTYELTVKGTAYLKAHKKLCRRVVDIIHGA